MTNRNVLILGGGLVGGPIALDLAKDSGLKVSVADISRDALDRLNDDRIRKIQADLADENELSALLADFDLIVNAVPGFMGYETLKRCIEAGKDVVDIAFYPEDVFGLSELAKQKKVRVIADMGVAPGMSNLLTGYAASKMDRVNNVEIFVGGLPKVRQLPWEYKAVFSPLDVLEEYTRPARLVENGEIVTKPPLTEIEHLEFDGIGTLEAFNSDGLRSLLFTIKARNMKEKTLRYPGYARKIGLLAENGFFDTGKLDFDGRQISPMEVTARLLFRQWKLDKDEADITVMRIVVEGEKDGKNIRYRYDLHDEYDPASGIHSMARTTGYSAAMAARLIAEEHFRETGITVPEMLGKNENHVLFILEGLKDRNVIYREKVELF
ncbi:MAG: saccharopine dehydrogenase [Chlorobi bacterium]|nr:saccharopine dehydrogenase [Chlorobiota bacterium]